MCGHTSDKSTTTPRAQNQIGSYVLKVLQKTLLHHQELVLDNLHSTAVSGNSNPTVILSADSKVRNSGYKYKSQRTRINLTQSFRTLTAVTH